RQPRPSTPSPTRRSSDLAALQKQKYDAVKITRSAEDFYVSLGFPKLPESFWERSMLTKPPGRDVQCHASAWHMDANEDVRIKQRSEEHTSELQSRENLVC